VTQELIRYWKKKQSETTIMISRAAKQIRTKYGQYKDSKLKKKEITNENTYLTLK
jgi:hypothetical protein